MEIFKVLKYIFVVAVISAAFFLSCEPHRDESSHLTNPDNINFVWYRQAKIDIGARIEMHSPNSGFAITSGRGNIKGQALLFNDGAWEEFYSFPYSDFPQIILYDSSTIWTINHLTHRGDYKPILSSFTNGVKKEIQLPKIMWDDIDYVMWKSLKVFSNGTAWLAGQQGSILFFNGNNWSVAESPINKKELTSLLAGDINDLFFVSDNNGWGVGKDGLIIRYKNGKWENYPTPTNKHLNRIWMLNDSHGYIAGNEGTLLELVPSENNTDELIWKQVDLETGTSFFSVKGIDTRLVIAVGNNSSFYFNDGSGWKREEYLKSLGENFNDVDLVKDSLNNYHIWLMGWNGIYTNSKSIGFSFTDYTSQASLRETGKSGLFFKKFNNKPDLFMTMEGGPSLLFQNNGKAKFSEINFSDGILDLTDDVTMVAAGDINNDGYNDLLLFYHAGKNCKVLLGSKNDFIDFTKRSLLDLSDVTTSRNISAYLADLDNDGNLDLYISTYEGRHIIQKGDGAGRFSKIDSSSGITYHANVHTVGVTISDFNSDGLLDIFVPYYSAIEGKNFELYLNLGDFRFEAVNNTVFKSPPELSLMTGVAVSADFNNDGHPDIFVHNQKTPPALLINNGDATFLNYSEQAGFTQLIFHPEPLNGTINAADVNNDGYMDLFLSSRLFINSPDLKFKEVSEQTGIDFIGNPSFEDIDDDGDIDLFIGSSVAALGKGVRSVLYRNNLNNDSFIKVNLNGDKSNRSAVGSKIFLNAYDNDDKLLTVQLREAGVGHSPMVQQNLNEIHFGITPANRYDIVVKFPSGIERIIENVQIGKTYSVNESSAIQKIYYRSVKSLNRTLLLLDPVLEIIKAIVIILIIVVLMLLGKRLGAGKYSVGFIFPIGLLLLYLYTIHYSVLYSEFIKIVLPFILVPLVGYISIIIAKSSIRRQEAKYISHYKVIETLGQGGMGKVYKAEDMLNKRIVALKVISPELMNDPDNKKRFNSEGKTLSSFNHPSIVKVYETGEVEGQGFIAMELLSGGTLKEYIIKNHPLNITILKRIALQILNGLSEIHSKNIIHRDLKAGNVMMDSSINIRIMDFGLSKSNLVTTMTSLGTVLGTLGYVAPEQVTNSSVDQRTDIFSFGVLLYEMCTNELPFKGENEIALIHAIFNTTPPIPSSININVSSIIDEIVTKCIQKDPGMRYSNVSELKIDIEKL